VSETLRFQLDDGATALFELAEDPSGVQRVSRTTDGVIEASQRLGEALQTVRSAAKAALEALKTLSPAGLELEFGVKLTAESGALIARTAAEGHFVVKVSWAPDDEVKTDSSADDASKRSGE
jgi:hypothetical protein